MRSGRGKKGIYFTVDAMIAVTVIFASLVLITKFTIHEKEGNGLSVIAGDIAKVFSTTKVRELKNAYAGKLIANGTIQNANNTIFEQLGEFSIAGQLGFAQQFVANLSEELVQKQYGFMVLFDGQVMYNNNKTLKYSLSSSKKMVSAVREDDATVTPASWGPRIAEVRVWE